MEDVFLDRPCPTCGRADPAGPVVYSRRRAEELGFAALRPYWHGFFKERIFFSYFRCRHCGQLYCPRFFDDDQLQALYRQMPDNTAGVPIDALRQTQGGYFQALRRYSPLTGCLLEVGPDTGLFTEWCVREGRFERYEMFEPNLAVHDALSRRLAGRDFRIHPKMFSLAAVPDASVSAAVMVHVLDHLIDPRSDLAGLRRKMSADGVLAIVTHDESSMLARALRARWPAYCLQHSQLYSPRSIRALLHRAGYRVLEVRKTANHFPLPYLVKHLLSAIGMGSVPLPVLHRPRIALKLGNIITLAAPRGA